MLVLCILFFVGFDISMVLLVCKCVPDIAQWFALIYVHSGRVRQRIVLHCRLQVYFSVCGLFNCVRKCADCVLSLRSWVGGFLKFDIVLYMLFQHLFEHNITRFEFWGSYGLSPLHVRVLNKFMSKRCVFVFLFLKMFQLWWRVVSV